jgi:hypothetical protein
MADGATLDDVVLDAVSDKMVTKAKHRRLSALVDLQLATSKWLAGK